MCLGPDLYDKASFHNRLFAEVGNEGKKKPEVNCRVWIFGKVRTGRKVVSLHAPLPSTERKTDLRSPGTGLGGE